ncbi:MAG TPA: PaaI family thioesterase [Polyangia bacterium]|nr:PaaI family thioesterase [Polyangia bacterium]
METPTVHNLFGEEMFHVEDGLVRWRYRVQAQHFNPVGALHGGVLSTLLDAVQGHALYTRIAAEGAFSAAITLNVNFLAPTRTVGDELIFEGRLLQVGKRVAFTEGSATNSAGVVVARATCTHAILKR